MTALRVVSGIPVLVQGVKDYFKARGRTDVSVVFGYRQRFQQLNQGVGGANRVCFLPGDPNGNGGKLAAAPRDVGLQEVFDTTDPEHPVHVANIRPLASWERQFAISVWGFDETDPLDELLQTVAAEALLEIALQGLEQVRGAGGPNVVWGNVLWTVPKENTLGAEVLVGLALAHPLMDAPEEIGFPGFDLKRHGIDDT